MNFSISIDPGDITASIDAVHEIVQTFRENVQNELESSGNDAVGRAKASCPVKTGKLRDSISAKQQNEGDLYSTEVSSSLEYAIFVELGHRKRGGKGIVAPRPFLVPAFEQTTPELLDALQSVVGED